MLFEEKIDQLKRKFSPADFKVPFVDGTRVLKSIEKEFIFMKDIKTDLNNLGQHCNNWADNIKDKIEIKSVDISSYSQWLDKLDKNTNYWAVLAYSRSPSTRHLVYDCKPIAISSLISITQDDFFIIDKKYKWFSYFQIDRKNKRIQIYKGGKKMTPFET